MTTTAENALAEIAGHFGPYGGRFVPEALIGALEELDAARIFAQTDPTFIAELAELHRTYTGRPKFAGEVIKILELRTRKSRNNKKHNIGGMCPCF